MKNRLTREHDRAKINLRLRLSRTIDDYGSEQATSVLRGVVRVIPRSSIQSRLKPVSVGLGGSNRALGDSRDTIFPLSILLSEPVPVERGSLRTVGDVVGDRHLDPVTPVGLYSRAGESAVHEQDLALIAIRGDYTAADGEVVFAGDAGVGPLFVVVGAVSGKLAPGKAVG